MLLTNLKTTKRTGWVRCNVSQPESIADHQYRMALMSLLASDCGVDATRCMKMSLVHDVAEAIVGDITPHCNVSEQDKFSLESRAIQQIKDMLGHHTQAGEAGRALGGVLGAVTEGGGGHCCRGSVRQLRCQTAALSCVVLGPASSEGLTPAVSLSTHPHLCQPHTPSLPPNPAAALLLLHTAQEVEVLWHEYEAQSTPESHLVKDFDKLEMIIQAHEYEQAQEGLQLQQFFDSTAGKFKTQTG